MPIGQANRDNRRLTSRYCFCLANIAISWASKKQTFVALSSTESKYMAMSKTTLEATWLNQLLQNLGFPQPGLALTWTAKVQLHLLQIRNFIPEASLWTLNTTLFVKIFKKFNFLYTI